MKKIAGLLSIFLIILLLACQMPADTGANNSSITIKNIGWIIANADLNYWSFTFSDGNPHCFYYFFIIYDGNISASDIEYVRVYIKNDGFWTLDVKNNPNLLDSKNKMIGGWSSHSWYYPDPNALPLQNLTAEVKLINGVKSALDVTFPDPGSLNNNHQYVYTEDCSSPPANSTPMIKKANIVSYSKTSSSISIKFNTNDSLFYNGLVELYDSSKNFIGVTTQLFRNESGTSNFIISGLNNNGADNTITLNESDITYYNGGSFNSIAKFALVLRDGSQYTGDMAGAYDCISLTRVVTF
jgi:hypothetical protein